MYTYIYFTLKGLANLVDLALYSFSLPNLSNYWIYLSVPCVL